MPNKQPNYLASRLEQQAAKSTALPNSLNQQVAKLFNLTEELKTILLDSLPNEILTTMWVVGFDNQQLTLTVTSQTAANHLMYLKEPLITLIASNSLTFNTLTHIKVIVTYVPNILKKANQSSLNSVVSTAINTVDPAKHTTLTDSNNLSKAPLDVGLTLKTKQTIAQTIEHVILDEKLKKSLSKLIE